MRQVTVDQARRIALAAQGFADPAPSGAVDRRHFRRVFRRIGLLQLDSVNVLVRSHYLPVLARLGPYDRSRLDDYTGRSGEIFEYWSHVASLLPVEDYPLYRHRMEGDPIWQSIAEVARDHPDYVRSVYDEITERGPLTVSDLSDPGARTGPWWGYGHGKHALEWLFTKGRITSRRTNGFNRVYDLTERVIPERLLDVAPVSEEEAHRTLLLKAARHHGIGTAKDLADYHRIRVPSARPILAGLVAAGELEQVAVDGWRGPVYLHPEAASPRRAHGTALLSPFDSLVWERDRTERLFGFHYRIEIYVPGPDRVHGYYVLPFLLDGELVGRTDLKADRKSRRLLVQSAWIEPGRDRVRVAAAMADRLRMLATWLDLDEIEVRDRGDLVADLRRALG